MKIYEVIRQYCNDNSISFTQLSESLKISKPYISALMCGDRKITLDIFINFLKIVNDKDKVALIEAYLNDLDASKLNLSNMLTIDKYNDMIKKAIKQYIQEQA